ncbi:hypothetical protein KO529_13490 [Arenibacter algicola]|uniref:hypothetical protein n=1 Tax=Arenibacter algicola TaxID=616991 RepID=UPI001C0795A6|nr:hypothetical protein [Arenibacter algicola]MBU2905807.1 hypothetical protein [Arenibacter algicola]
MSEIELLKKLVDLEKTKNTLEIQIDVWNGDGKVVEFKRELDLVEAEIAEKINELQEIEDKKYSRKAKNSMYSQIQAYITEINKVKEGLKLSRNQGLGLENYLFSGILNDLRYYIIDDFGGHRIPAYLMYTRSDENSVEVSELSDFLNTELHNLSEIENPNYIKLREFYEDFKNRMIKKFVE